MFKATNEHYSETEIGLSENDRNFDLAHPLAYVSGSRVFQLLKTQNIPNVSVKNTRNFTKISQNYRSIINKCYVCTLF